MTESRILLRLLSKITSLTLVLLFLVACGTPEPAPAPVPPTATRTPVPPTATPTPVPPTSTPAPIPATPTSVPTAPSMWIALAAEVPEWAAGKIELEVLAGGYRLTTGATARAGSLIYVIEDFMTFPKGLMIDVGEGGVTLGGITYPEGTRLIVDEGGTLTKTE